MQSFNRYRRFQLLTAGVLSATKSFARQLGLAALTLALLAPQPLQPLVTVPTAAAHDGIDIVTLARDSRDSIVSVSGKSILRRSGNFRYRPNPFDFFGPFFRDFPQNPRRAPKQEPPQQERPQRPAAIGSGFIIDVQGKDGYILTNAHVIANSTEIVISLANGNEYDAEVIGSDPLTDIALLKITPEDSKNETLTPLPIGDSKNLQVGESIIAVGSPFGLDQTVTSGIISALSRRLPREDYVPFIQTDASVNPGNSGGPLLNGKGEVIGINSQIISPIRASAGISFAIPIHIAMDIQARLRAGGSIKRGLLGIIFTSVTELDAQAFGLDKPRGALVQQVSPDTGAAEAGIVPGDIILSVDGEAVESSEKGFNELPTLIGNHEPGQQVTLGIWREGEEISVVATLGSLDGPTFKKKFFGMSMDDLDDEIRQRSGVNGGVVVTGIDFEDEDAAEGIDQFRVGDIITHALVKQRFIDITRLDDIRSVVKNFKGGALAFRVWRDGRRIIITINV